MTIQGATPDPADGHEAPRMTPIARHRISMGLRAVNMVRRLLGSEPKPAVLDSANVFSEIYRQNLWGSNESRSGTGSTLASTDLLRRGLGPLLRELHVQVLLDAPCGDFRWMSHVDLGEIHYVGADVVTDLITSNARAHGSSRRQFIAADLTRDTLPSADLVLCRHLLIHLSFSQGLSVLDNFRRTGARHLLVTTDPTVRKNREVLHTGGFRPLNMELPPFNLPPPLGTLSDGQREGDGTVLGVYGL